MKLLSMLPMAALILFLAGCGTAPYEGDAAQSQVATDDALDRAEGEPEGDLVIDDFQPDMESDKSDSETQDD